MLLSHGLTLVVSIPFLLQGTPTLAGWGALGFLGIFQIGLPSLLLNYGVKHVTAVQSLLTAVLEPLFNPLWVFLVLGERPGPRALAGGAIILAAVTARSLVSLRSALRPVAAG
jgi:drug/metabolite transporter (DMT)-like permease